MVAESQSGSFATSNADVEKRMPRTLATALMKIKTCSCE
jgi:hypothetical protein